MKLTRWLIGISCAVGIVSAGSKVFSQPANQVAQRPESQWSTVQTYCFGCHTSTIRSSPLPVGPLSADSVPGPPEIFEKVVRKLKFLEVPFADRDDEREALADALVGWLESTLD